MSSGGRKSFWTPGTEPNQPAFELIPCNPVFLWMCSSFDETSKDYGEENHGWSYLFKPYGRNTTADTFRPRLALELGT
ncbi:hypothetical protein YC2023_085252 [Brassica napus]